jgi:uncharacterized glyoxalase superfamily protein PhnB
MSALPEFLGVVPLVPAGGDVDLAVAFYKEKLGFHKLWQDGSPTEMAAVKRGTVEFLLYRNDDRSLADQTSLRILVTHIDQLYADLRARGIVVREAGMLQAKPWGTKEFAVADPAGVCITFYEREPV